MVESGKNTGSYRSDDDFIRQDAGNMANNTRYSSAICRCPEPILDSKIKKMPYISIFWRAMQAVGFMPEITAWELTK